MIPVSGLLAGCLPRASIVIRTFASPAVDVFGRSSAAANTTVTEFVPVHPATSRKTLERLRESDRDKETIAIYVSADSALAPVVGRIPAEVDYLGATYTVVAVGVYADQGGVYLVLAQRQ